METYFTSMHIIDRETDRLGIGQRGKLGGPGDGKAGIFDFNGSTADEIINEAKKMYRIDYKKKNGIEFTDEKTYPSRTWFTYVKKRRPIILVYMIDVDVDLEEINQKKQVELN